MFGKIACRTMVAASALAFAMAPVSAQVSVETGAGVEAGAEVGGGVRAGVGAEAGAAGNAKVEKPGVPGVDARAHQNTRAAAQSRHKRDDETCVIRQSDNARVETPAPEVTVSGNNALC